MLNEQLSGTYRWVGKLTGQNMFETTKYYSIWQIAPAHEGGFELGWRLHHIATVFMSRVPRADGPSNSDNELLQDCRFLQFKTTLTGGRKAIVLFDLVEFGVLILEKEATAGRSSASEQTPVRWHAIRWNEESRRESNEL